jgi:hypothetical protein
LSETNGAGNRHRSKRCDRAEPLRFRSVLFHSHFGNLLSGITCSTVCVLGPATEPYQASPPATKMTITTNPISSFQPIAILCRACLRQSPFFVAELVSNAPIGEKQQ